MTSSYDYEHSFVEYISSREHIAGPGVSGGRWGRLCGAVCSADIGYVSSYVPREASAALLNIYFSISLGSYAIYGEGANHPSSARPARVWRL